MPLINYRTSGHHFSEQESQLAFRFRVLNTFMAVGITFSLLIGLLGDLGVMDIGTIQPKVNYLYALFNLLMVCYLRQSKHHYRRVAWAQVIASFITFTLALLLVEYDEFRIIWLYIGVYISYILLGGRAGSIMTLAALVAIVVATQLVELHLTPTAIYTAIFALLAFSLLARAHAVQVGVFEQLLSSQKEKLEQNVSKLDRALVRAQEASRAKSLFLANMSHEIRTPMNGVLGMVQVLQATEMAQQQYNYLSAIERSGKSLLLLIDELLDLSRIESGRLKMYPEPFDVGVWLDDILTIAEPLFEQGSVSFVTEVENTLPSHLVGDAARLKQVVVNRISNAAKFTREGEMRLTIGGKWLEEGLYRLQVEVSDSGIGIPPEQQRSIFERFAQVSPERIANKGVGLGLAICRRLIDAMEGEIGVESQPGEGSRFHVAVTLPACRHDEVGGKHGQGEPGNEPLTILLVDDDGISRLAVKTLLGQQGHRVIEAVNGLEALELLERQRPDLVLMDVHMPEMDGVSATRAIKGSADTTIARLPVIGMTASVMNDELEGYLQAGMAAVVYKPIDIAQVVETIQGALSREAKGDG